MKGTRSSFPILDPMEHEPTVKEWLQSVDSKPGLKERALDHISDNAQSLISTATLHELSFGTGCSLYTDSILPAIEKAEAEVILVTCFWARSATLDGLNNTLKTLSDKGLQSRMKIRVRICFSSSSLFQKLFHTSSPHGRTYLESELHKTLGLPRPGHLLGLDLEVRSIFFLPFSVMHPKFVVIDRARILLPSCNVSWEDWFEGCLDLTGPIVGQFVRFWLQFWANARDRESTFEDPASTTTRQALQSENEPTVLSRHVLSHEARAIFLYSQHERNPRFAPLPWQSCPPPRSTPLNAFLLSAFSNAKKSIYIQTPNLTAPPVLHALLAGLRTGVSVELVTSERLMILEQLVTAGTTTKRCVKVLIKRHKDLVRRWRDQDSALLEANQIARPGTLSIKFYQPASAGTSFCAEYVWAITPSRLMQIHGLCLFTKSNTR